jgi:hypothetical protein
MIAKLRCILFLACMSLPAAIVSTAQAQSGTGGYTWPLPHNFYLPYGSKDGAPVYAKPSYQGVGHTLTCKEATGILKMHGYRDIAELSCAGDVYRFEVSRVEGRFLIDLDPRTGNIVRRQRL